MANPEKNTLADLSDDKLAERKKQSLIIFAVLLFIASASLLIRVFMGYSEGGYEGPDYLMAIPVVAMVAILFADRHEKAKKEIKRRAQQAES